MRLIFLCNFIPKISRSDNHLLRRPWDTCRMQLVLHVVLMLTQNEFLRQILIKDLDSNAVKQQLDRSRVALCVHTDRANLRGSFSNADTPTRMTQTNNLSLTYLLTYLLTPWSRVLLEKPDGSQLTKKFPAIYGTQRFITAFQWRTQEFFSGGGVQQIQLRTERTGIWGR